VTTATRSPCVTSKPGLGGFSSSDRFCTANRFPFAHELHGSDAAFPAAVRLA
jgi:hypothetical protein